MSAHGCFLAIVTCLILRTASACIASALAMQQESTALLYNVRRPSRSRCSHPHRVVGSLVFLRRETLMVVSWMVRVLGVVALSVAIGCGSSGDGGKKDDGKAGSSGMDTPGGTIDSKGNDVGAVGTDLMIAFSPMYSAYIDDEHPCKIPAIVTGLTGAKWSTTDSSIVRLEEDTMGVMITTKKAGEVDIIARVGALSGKAHLTITAFTAAEWQAGNDRYNSSVKYMAPTMAEIMMLFQQAQMAAGDGGMVNFRDVIDKI